MKKLKRFLSAEYFIILRFRRVYTIYTSPQ